MSVPAHSSVVVPAPFTGSDGEHTIAVRVDEDDIKMETNDTNNEAIESITFATCCIGRVGDANCSNEPTDEVTLGDIMLMVDAKFISGDCSKLPCLAEADVNQDGSAHPDCDEHVTLGDIMTLVDFLFITGPENATLPDCL